MIDRRDFLIGSVAGLASACSGAPAVRTSRPGITHGVQVGDVQTGSALVWARCTEAGRMLVEWDTTDRFAHPRRVTGPVVTPDADHTATVTLTDLPPAQLVFVRVKFERVAGTGTSDWATARFATPHTDGFRVAWTGDTCGQGFGRNPDWGGLRGFAALRGSQPAFWINSGDLIYADNPILAEHTTLAGQTWKNITNDRVNKVAETLDEFRGRFEYNLDDEHVRALAAEVPVIAQWDDHETHNNWWPGQQLDDDRYKDRDASRLAALARRAMFEWTPLPTGPMHRVIHYGPLLDVIVLDARSYRTPNDEGIATTMFGAEQARWLVDQLAASKARWKLVACDQPIGLVIGDGAQAKRREGFADGVDGPPGGREVELAAVLSALKTRGVKDTAWITADVHYPAAHQFDPARGKGVDFTPFWEFIAGPIHAGTFGPEPLDPTLGPEVKFQWVPPAGTGNLAPSDGLQSYGTIDVSPDALSVKLWGILEDKPRFTVELT